ncbi:adenylate cyclase, partial [Escherichia coli]|nr:adenylate cyclase [Escherichia coli]
STLRQFATILAELGLDADWLDAYRPPRTLHYAGQMRIRNDATQSAGIDAVLAAENIGFGYGALAAGADMLIAERLLARDAELHVTLPSP